MSVPDSDSFDTRPPVLASIWKTMSPELKL